MIEQFRSNPHMKSVDLELLNQHWIRKGALITRRRMVKTN